MTWASSIQHTTSQAFTVRVRARVSWSNNGDAHYFIGANFDPFVLRQPETHLQDAISNPVFLTSLGLSENPNAVIMAVGPFLKIDRANDLDLPGLGPSWMTASQNRNLGLFDVSNPLTIVEFDYFVDGSSGVRSISSVLSQSSQGSIVLTHSLTNAISVLPATVLPATITVIPAPGVLALLAPPALAAARRRR